MARRKAGAAPKRAGKKKRQTVARAPRVARRRQRTGKARGKAGMNGAMASYHRMVSDPCHASFARPPYSGTDAGYFIRTVDTWRPNVNGLSGITVGADYYVDFFAQYTPSLVSATQAYLVAGNLANLLQNTPTWAAATQNLFVTQSPVKRFRPVAACFKWCPSGSYSKRAGTVGLGYAAGLVTQDGGASFFASSGMNQALSVEPNGSKAHEVLWLPTAADEQWNINSSGVATDPGRAGGTMFIQLQNVDAIGATMTSVGPSGYFEVTTIWEWEPGLGNGINNMPARPAPFTTQQHQSTIANLGKFLVRAGEYALDSYVRVLTAGVKNSSYRSPNLLM